VQLVRLAFELKEVNITQFESLENFFELHHGMGTSTSDLKQQLGSAMFDVDVDSSKRNIKMRENHSSFHDSILILLNSRRASYKYGDWIPSIITYESEYFKYPHRCLGSLPNTKIFQFSLESKPS
jgi:hypothetical protein